MIRVFVRLEGAPPQEISFDQDVIAIGRIEGSDLRLLDPSISQKHATIRRSDTETFVLVDEGSRNGSFLGGVRLKPNSPRILRSGDLFRVGRIWIEVKIDDVHDAALDHSAATRELALAMVSRIMKLDAPTVRVVEGASLGRSVVLKEANKAYRIGRADTSDLVLDDVDVSREHVQVTRRGASVFLRDLGSRNRAHLGDAELAGGADVVWPTRKNVRIGSTVLALDEPVDRAIAELAAAPDVALAGRDEAAATPATPSEPAEIESFAAPISEALARPSQLASSDAPVASLSSAEQPTIGKARSTLPLTRMAIVGSAVAVIAFALVALVWLFRQ